MSIPYCVCLFIGALVAADSAHFWCHKTKEGFCEIPKNDFISQQAMRELVHDLEKFTPSSSAAPVNASTIRNKVLAGYQGWDGARNMWDHWSKDGKVPSPLSKNEHFEMVPQMGEYPAGALHSTDFKYIGNGSAVKLFENSAGGVVDLHVQWMKDYGLDGVLIQRFISECTKSGKALTQRNMILQQLDAAATKHGRVYAMMWDMSGASKQWDEDIKKDFQTYVKKYTTSQQYLKENGRPVVCIFGIGLIGHDQATPASSLALIRWLQDQGLYVIGSGPYYWRTGGHDALHGFDKVHAAFDAIMPWSVGRYNSVTDFHNRLTLIEGDAALTSGRKQDYAPIAYAGYSYRDSNKVNFIKRNAGKFFKAQSDAFLAIKGATFYYIAMFDEVQEGTAIYKFAANASQSAAGRPFVTASIDGVQCPGDLYLRLAGQYAAAAKGHGPAPPPLPTENSLDRGSILDAGDSLHSINGKAHLEMQAADGNLVLYSGNHGIWSSNTTGESSHIA